MATGHWSPRTPRSCPLMIRPALPWSPLPPARVIGGRQSPRRPWANRHTHTIRSPRSSQKSSSNVHEGVVDQEPCRQRGNFSGETGNDPTLAAKRRRRLIYPNYAVTLSLIPQVFTHTYFSVRYISSLFKYIYMHIGGCWG